MNWFKREHECDYEAVAVDVRQQPLGPARTVILWRCKCNGVMSETIDGKWTLAEVRGEREATPEEKADALIAEYGAKASA